MENEVTDPETGEVTQALAQTIDMSLAVGLSRAEIDSQIQTARQFPRSITLASENILTLATLNLETATECNYALPRAGKVIQGPSIRLAEIIAQCWGNCRVAARVVTVDRKERFVEAEGVFHDLQTNAATLARIRRRIVDSKGRLFSDDMINMAGNACCSIARRNAILAGVPKGVWSNSYEQSKRVVVGSVKSIAKTREDAVAAFAEHGVKPEQIFHVLGLSGLDDITLHHVLILRGMFSALKSGESTLDEMFPAKSKAASAHEIVVDPLANEIKESEALGNTPASDKAEVVQPQASVKQAAADSTPSVAATSSQIGSGPAVPESKAAEGSPGTESPAADQTGAEKRSLASQTAAVSVGSPPASAETAAADLGKAQDVQNASPAGSIAPGAENAPTLDPAAGRLPERLVVCLEDGAHAVAFKRGGATRYRNRSRDNVPPGYDRDSAKHWRAGWDAEDKRAKDTESSS
jgi:hypothetical protein